MDEAIAILKLCAIEWPELEVHALHDGDEVEPWETVLLIEGPYDAFAHLETLYLGVLSRRTRVATNTRRVVEAAAPKEIMFFPARHDHWLVQTGDGYAAHVAGAIGVSTDAQASWWGSEGVGTVPHALIAAYGGDTVLATRKFAEHIGPEVKLISLVDFENDCVGTSLAGGPGTGGRACTACGSIPARCWWIARSSTRWARSSPPGSIRSWCGMSAEPSMPAGFPAGQDRSVGRVHGGQDSRLRAARGAGGWIRGGIVALSGPVRFHRRRRAARGEAVRQGGEGVSAESAIGAGRLRGER